MTNVVQFPSNRRVRPGTIEEANESIRLACAAQCEGVAELIFEQFFIISCGAGFDFPEDEVYLKDLALVLQVLKSILMKHQGLVHPLQQMAEDSFEDHGDGKVVFKSPARVEAQGTI